MTELLDTPEKEKFISTWFKSALEKETHNQGFLGGEKESYVPTDVNLDDYSESLLSIYQEYDKAGYEVIEVVPITTGQSESSNRGKRGDDLTYSITRGAVVIGKLKNDFN